MNQISHFDASSAAPTLTQSAVYPFDALPVTHAANGGESRGVLHGVLATGERVSLHESMQPTHAQPNPAHAIHHSEVILISEGTVEFLHDGLTERAGLGSVLFVAFGANHQLRNIGDGPAKYFVVAIGGDVK